MAITFISAQQAVLTFLLFCLLGSLYFWLVRPILQDQGRLTAFYAAADTFWAKVWEWIKVRWDMALASAVVLAPIVWNGGLDLLIGLSLLLADLFPALNGLDLSGLVLPPQVKTYIQVGSTVFPILRKFILERKPA